jgi:hypothetical protein
MDNSYFIFTEKDQSLEIERFHICTWEFRDNTSLVEFGLEITSSSITGKQNIVLELVVPWLKENFTVNDFYSKLKDAQNSRFIFNDSISGTTYLDGRSNNNGIIHKFIGRNELAILPLIAVLDYNRQRIVLNVNLSLYHELAIGIEGKPNIYFRFSITPIGEVLSTRKRGVAKSTIIYDVKINERRNIPDNLITEIIQKDLCEIKSCFCFHIIPNSYDLIFFDSGSLKNVRTLEFDSFNRYLNDNRVKKDDLIVVFNRRNKLNSYAFFSIYTKEYIGANQFALALLVNLISGILLFIPSFKSGLSKENQERSLLNQLPFEFWLAITLILIMVWYFSKSWVSQIIRKSKHKK